MTAPLPGIPGPDELYRLALRAKRLSTRCGNKNPDIPKRDPTGRDLRKLQATAVEIVNYENNGACALLARDVLFVIGRIDAILTSILPVLDLINDAIRKDGCSIEVTPDEFLLKTHTGKVVSRGGTFKELLMDHYFQFGKSNAVHVKEGKA